MFLTPQFVRNRFVVLNDGSSFLEVLASNPLFFSDGFFLSLLLVEGLLIARDSSSFDSLAINRHFFFFSHSADHNFFFNFIFQNILISVPIAILIFLFLVIFPPIFDGLSNLVHLGDVLTR